MRQPRLFPLLLVSAYILFVRLLPFILSLLGMDISKVGFFPWTFMPAFAFCLFSVGTVKDRRMALGLPFLLQLLGDAAIGVLFGLKFGASEGLKAAIYPDQAFVYLGVLLMCGMGWIIRKWRNPLTITLGAVTTPTLYFLLTNFGSWVTDPSNLYASDLSGLLASYEAGLEFYKYSLVSTALYCVIFFSPQFDSLMFEDEQLEPTGELAQARVRDRE